MLVFSPGKPFQPTGLIFAGIAGKTREKHFWKLVNCGRKRMLEPDEFDDAGKTLLENQP